MEPGYIAANEKYPNSPGYTCFWVKNMLNVFKTLPSMCILLYNLAFSGTTF